MNSRIRDILLLVVGLAVVLAAAFGGYAAVRARAAGVGRQPGAGAGATPKPARARSASRRSTSAGRSARPSGPVTVYTQPRMSAPVKTQLGKVNQNGYPTLVLVDSTREVDGRVWYRVWLAIRPNESQGWVPEGKLAFYTTTAKITIDLSERKLSVYRRGELAEVPRSGREARPEHAHRVLLRQSEAPAGDAWTAPTAYWRSASARSSPNWPTGRRAGRWLSTAPTSRG